ncbi:class I SAM-dependent DNA methyltransferase [Melaminivora suipulveris]|uniref:site-specific DNA-methyltransferase (adenine-specific) n=1 Tax=Melaminivora suipulveris TaxID=2109913 RepID=A0A2R3QCZ5_9BURK|nr:DNA methyltransferase [Melaminivora suipulveris]AVO49646.1 class I SAM-dependent DNA methyltransferase [Melaminivora suipulveris]
MTPAQFIAKWGPAGTSAHLNEEQGAQSHFLDLCELLEVPKPGSPDVADEYVFERRSLVLGESRGYADVFYRDHFAWENKAPGKNLDAALRQLQQYSLALANPPLLVVCDRLTIRVHTQFNGHPSETHTVRIDQLDQSASRELLRRLWLAPESFRPRQTNRDITEEAARSFALLAEQLRGRGHHADAVAHFLTQCLFCFFAEDVGLLPARMFERLVNNRQLTSERLTQGLASLFATMRDGGLYGADDIPWFNGGLFARISVPKLEIIDITELRNAASLNWSAIDVSIFGTLFERGLDPAKRSQLGAHYTDPATIARIIEPVITRPLLSQWELVAQELQGLTAKIKKHGDAAHKKAHNRFVQWLEVLRNYRALDPACGSGNFLFLGLKALKDVELLTITAAADLGLDREQDLVTGVHNMLGIELNEYAAELARVSLWIGEIQWRIAHGYPPKTNPVLEPLEQIECRDALLAWQGEGEERQAVEAGWPRADVVVGNPPFLGDKKMRRELGDAYVDALRKTYAGRVPGGADLVCYWFDKALAQIDAGQLQRAGLVSTNSIRGGKNRAVLDAIVQRSRIYEAWSDEAWVNEGAAVRVSLVAFGHTRATAARLNNQNVAAIWADLTASSEDGDISDLTTAQRLAGNRDTCFVGTSKKASFDISGDVARSWLHSPNPHGRSNSEVVKPWINGADLVRRPSDTWIVDFGTDCGEHDAALFEAPFAHVYHVVKPEKAAVRNDAERRKWWLHARTAPDMRRALRDIHRFAATAIVAKHRVWIWQPFTVLPSHATCVSARADDTTFGILHSRFHELWSLRMGTSLEDRPRYTPTTCFETFPFPPGLTPQNTAHQRTEALPCGALIPADLPEEFKPKRASAGVNKAQAAINSIAPPPPPPPPPPP